MENRKILKTIHYYELEKEKLIKEINNKNNFSMSMIVSKAEMIKELDLKISALQIALNN